MDGMNYHRKIGGGPGTSTRDSDVKISAVLMTLGFITAMLALTLFLHWLGWTAPDIEMIGS